MELLAGFDGVDDRELLACPFPPPGLGVVDVEPDGLADGDWFAVFLGARPQGYPPCYHLGREAFLSPVTWSDDGFPVIGMTLRRDDLGNFWFTLMHEVGHVAL